MKYGKMSLALDLIARGRSFASIARDLEISDRSIYNWITWSRNGDPKMRFDWGGQEASFAEHLQNARAMAIAHLEALTIEQAEYFEEQVIYEGQEQFKLDPRMIGLSDDECQLCFGTKDRFLRTPDGSAIPLTVKRKGSDTARLRILEAHMKKYAAHSTSDINVNVGVTRLARPGDAAKQIKQAAPEPFAIEDKSTEEAKPTIVIGRPAETSEELAKWEKDGAFIPHGVEFEDAEGETTTVGGSAKPMEILANDTPLARELKEKHNSTLEKATDLAKLPPKMPPQVQVFPEHDPDGDDVVTGQPPSEAKPKPVAQSDDDLMQHPAYLEAMQRKADGLDGRNAVERQLMNGNLAVLRASRAGVDRTGTGGPDQSKLRAAKPGDPDFGNREPVAATVTTRQRPGRRIVV
jgi:hypothetical protein